MSLKVMRFQIGKSGVTSGIIDSLVKKKKNHKEVRISALKASGRNRENIEKMALEIIEKLNQKNLNCISKTIGFTIILKKISKK